jgi:hypothetical protein
MTGVWPTWWSTTTSSQNPSLMQHSWLQRRMPGGCAAAWQAYWQGALPHSHSWPPMLLIAINQPPAHPSSQYKACSSLWFVYTASPACVMFRCLCRLRAVCLDPLPLTRRAQEAAAAQQRGQENRQRAAARGAAAAQLLAAQRQRRDMEATLQQLEQNTLAARLQDIASGNADQAPLLRKLRSKETQAAALRAFETEFLPRAGADAQLMPSFVAVEVEEPAAAAGAGAAAGRGGSKKDTGATVRALNLVAQLRRQQAARRQKEREAAAAAAAAAQEEAKQAAAAAAAEAEPVVVEDLMDHIPPAAEPTAAGDKVPPASSAPQPQPKQQPSPEAAGATPGSAGSTASSSDSLSVVLAQARQALQRVDASATAMAAAAAAGGPAADAARTEPAAARGEGQQQQQQQQQQQHEEEDVVLTGSASSMDSLGAILREAQEVLQRLPADIAAALAAEDAAAAAATAEGAAGGPSGTAGAGSERGSVSASLADAAAVLEELKLLHDQLGLQVGRTACWCMVHILRMCSLVLGMCALFLGMCCLYLGSKSKSGQATAGCTVLPGLVVGCCLELHASSDMHVVTRWVASRYCSFAHPRPMKHALSVAVPPPPPAPLYLPCAVPGQQQQQRRPGGAGRL